MCPSLTTTSCFSHPLRSYETGGQFNNFVSMQRFHFFCLETNCSYTSLPTIIFNKLNICFITERDVQIPNWVLQYWVPFLTPFYIAHLNFDIKVKWKLRRLDINKTQQWASSSLKYTPCCSYKIKAKKKLFDCFLKPSASALVLLPAALCLHVINWDFRLLSLLHFVLMWLHCL